MLIRYFYEMSITWDEMRFMLWFKIAAIWTNFDVKNISICIYLSTRGKNFNFFKLVIKILFRVDSSGAIRFMLRFNMGALSSLSLKSNAGGHYVRKLVYPYLLHFWEGGKFNLSKTPFWLRMHICMRVWFCMNINEYEYYEY